MDTTLSQESNEPLYMYLLVNNDVKMGKGKIAGQVGHVVGLITEEIIQTYYTNAMENKFFNREPYQRYMDWKKKGHAKIILKASQAELEAFSLEKESVFIRDSGKTQIAPNTLTVVGFYPSVELKDKFSHLKLL